MWESEGEAWSEDERVSSCGSHECNVYNDAFHVIGLYGPGDKISLLPAGLGAGKGGTELSHGPGHAVPGNEWALVGGLLLPKGPSSQQEKPISHRGRAETETERFVVREMKVKEREWRALLSFVELASFLRKVLMSGMVCLWSKGFPSFLCATVWCSYF